MVIEIWTKDKYSANEEKELAARLSRAGLQVRAAKLSRLYRVEAAWPEKDFSFLASDLLADRLTERSSISRRPGMGGSYRVEVWLKKSATDVIGESVKEAIHDMIGRAPAGVRFGRAYYVEGPSTKAAAGAYARKLRTVVAKTLANETVHNFTID